MKKPTIFTSLLLLILLSICPSAVYATQIVENMAATVGVNAVFNIVVFPASLDFPSTDPGTTTPQRDLTLWCSTNSNQPWSLLISDTAELTAGPFTIPNSNFNWWGWSAGSGTWNAGTADLSTTPFTFYNAGIDEYITGSPVEIHLSFNVDLPANQAAGSYVSTLVITMTE